MGIDVLSIIQRKINSLMLKDADVNRCYINHTEKKTFIDVRMQMGIDVISTILYNV